MCQHSVVKIIVMKWDAAITDFFFTKGIISPIKAAIVMNTHSWGLKLKVLK